MYASVCARAIILIPKLKRTTNDKNATCDDRATTRAVAPRGLQSGRRDSSSNQTPLDLF